MQLRNVPKLMSRVPTLVSMSRSFIRSFITFPKKTYSNVCSSKNSTLSTCPTFAYNRYNEPSCSVECDIKEQRGYTYKKTENVITNHHAVFSTLQNANFYQTRFYLFLTNFLFVYLICF